MHQPAGVPRGHIKRRIGEVAADLYIVFKIFGGNSGERITVGGSGGIKFIRDDRMGRGSPQGESVKPFLSDGQMIDLICVDRIKTETAVQITADGHKINGGFVKDFVQSFRQNS